MSVIHFRGSGIGVPVGKILCLGRNYPEHAREMHSAVPSTPIVFLKPSTAIIPSGADVILPPFARVLHHEVELVVVIGKGGKHIPRAGAFDHVSGYATGLDMTLRDVQTEAKKNGLPWSVAKGFDTSAPLSTIAPRREVPDPHVLDIRLSVNGVDRQHSNTGQMIFPIDALISYISDIFTLEEGDLIFTGTPEGVGPVVPGDVIEAEIESVGSLSVGVASTVTLERPVVHG